MTPYQPLAVTALPTIQPAEKANYVKAHISHYYPGWGGPNCSRFIDGVCLSNMASGKPWERYIDKACACPSEYPFGTVFVVDGKEWICLDRGGAIVREGNKIWLDLLTKKPIVPHGTVLKVEVK